MTTTTLLGFTASAPWVSEALAVLLKGTLLLAAAALLVAALRGASAAKRHLLLGLTLAGLLALPVLTLAVPSWSVPVPGLEVALPSAAQTPVALPAGRMEPVDVSGAAAVAQSPDGVALSAAPEPVATGAPEPSLPWYGWVLVVWGAGSTLFLTWMLAGQWQVRRLSRRAEAVEDSAWTSLAGELGGRIGLRRRVPLLRTDRSSMPMACGIVRPKVLLPAESDEWTDAHRRAVLMHELAHVKRRDCLTQGIAQLACALYWFHPGVWWAARRLRVERERACDDAVLAAGTRPSEYAAGLLELARRFRPASGIAAATVSMARPSQLEGRVLAVLDGTRDRREPSRRTYLTAAGVALMTIVPLAAMTPVAASIEANGSSDVAYSVEPMQLVASATGGDQDLRWRGRLDEGQTLSVHTVNGPIRAVRSNSDVAEVLGERRERRRDQQEVRMETVEHAGGVTVCILPDDDDGQRCTAEGIRGDRSDRGRSRQQGPRTVELTVRVPDGASLHAGTMNGALELEGVRANVRARTMNGAIRASAAGSIQAHTMNGAVDVVMGRTDWSGDLKLETMNGGVRVVLPDDASTEVSARTMSGRIRSDFPLEIDSRPGRNTASGTLGQGGRSLTLSTMNGAIRIEREGGPVAGGGTSSAEVPASYPDNWDDFAASMEGFGERMAGLGDDISRIVAADISRIVIESVVGGTQHLDSDGLEARVDGEALERRVQAAVARAVQAADGVEIDEAALEARVEQAVRQWFRERPDRPEPPQPPANP